MTTKDLLELGQTLQAANLAGMNYRLFKKKKKKVADFLGVGVANIAGASLIQAQADITGGMD